MQVWIQCNLQIGGHMSIEKLNAQSQVDKDRMHSSSQTSLYLYKSKQAVQQVWIQSKVFIS